MNLRLVGERQIHALLYPEANAIQAGRPQTRGDCVNGPRPCPWVGCRHHLYLNVSPTTGSMTLNFPKVPVWDLKESCSLDVVDQHPGGLDMTELADLLKLTKERIRQIQDAAEAQLRATAAVELGEVDLPRPPRPEPAPAPRPIVRRPPHTPPRPGPTVTLPPLRRGQLALWILPAVPKSARRRAAIRVVVMAVDQLPLPL